MRIFKIILILFLACSCGTKNKTISTEKPEWAEEIENEGYTYIGETKTPSGIWDTLMLGYTERQNGIYHNKTERFKKLRIKGYEFKASSDKLFKLMIYQFEFEDLKEKERFERFQGYILNYQIHSKNNAAFYEKEGDWFLRFEPMP